MLTYTLFVSTTAPMVTHIFNSYHEWKLASLCSCTHFIDLLRPSCTVAPPFQKHITTDPSVRSPSALGIPTTWSCDHREDNWLVIAWVRHNQITKSNILTNSFPNVWLTYSVKQARKKNGHTAKLTPSICIRLSYWLRLTCKTQHMITVAVPVYFYLSQLSINSLSILFLLPIA